jgi:hypothetical protein
VSTHILDRTRTTCRSWILDLPTPPASKKLCYQITMANGPKADKKRRNLFRKLINTANEVFDMGNRCYH